MVLHAGRKILELPNGGSSGMEEFVGFSQELATV